jgi:hypothetical protein
MPMITIPPEGFATEGDGVDDIKKEGITKVGVM